MENLLLSNEENQIWENSSMGKGKLGEELVKFFRSILENSEYKYKIFVARGCSTLLETLFEEKFFNADDYDNVMTDSGLLTRMDEIVEYFICEETFPKILIVDDMLKYGKSINTFILEIENLLLDMLKKRGIEFDQVEIRKRLSRTVDIEVFIAGIHGEGITLNDDIRYNYDNVLLMDEYKRNYKPYFKMVMYQFNKQRDELFNRLSKVDSVRSAYTVGVKLDYEKYNSLGVLLNKIGYKKTIPQEPFIEDKIFNNYETYQCYYPNKSKPKVISTFRIFSRSTSFWCIPYIYFMDLSENGFNEVFDLVSEKFKLLFNGKPLCCLTESDRVKAEILSTTLNFKLLKMVLNFIEPNLCNDWLYKNTDYKKIARNYGGNMSSLNFMEDLIGQEAPTYIEFDNLIKYICDHISFELDVIENESCPINETCTIINDLLYKYSIASETVSYHYLNGDLTRDMINNSGKAKSLKVIFNDIYNEAKNQNLTPNVEEIFAELLILMDSGYISTIIRKVSYLNGNIGYTHLMRVSENAQTLVPKKLAVYIPILIEMDLQSFFEEGIKNQIYGFYAKHKDCEELANKLWNFVKSLILSGQNLFDWKWCVDLKKGYCEEKYLPECNEYRKWFYRS